MPTIDSLPAATTVNPIDRLVINQTNEDGSVTLRKVDASAFASTPDGISIQLLNGVLSVVFGTGADNAVSGAAFAYLAAQVAALQNPVTTVASLDYTNSSSLVF